MDLKDNNIKKQVKKIISKTFGRKISHSLSNPKTTMLINLGELYEYTSRVSKVLVNRKNSKQINKNLLKEKDIKYIESDPRVEEVCEIVWNKALLEANLKWSRIYKEHVAKENYEILKENKKMKKKVEQIDTLIEKELEKTICNFVMSFYLDSLDEGDRVIKLYNKFFKEGYLKKAENKYNRGEMDDEELL